MKVVIKVNKLLKKVKKIIISYRINQKIIKNKINHRD